MSRRFSLTTGPVVSTLARMTGPMLFGILAIIAFNLVDTFFIARLGALPLAAISFTFPVVMTLGSLAIGLGTGAGAVIAQALGRGDRQEFQRLTTDALFLGILVVAVFSAIGLATIEPLFRALGAGEEVLPHIVDYMTVWYVGMVFVVIPMVGNSVIRATGDTRVPGMIMTAAAIVNGVLDPLLIFGCLGLPAMGIRGAAIATVIGRATTMVLALRVLVHREHAISWSVPRAREVLASWRRILRVGIPTTGTQLLVPLSIAVITRLAAGFGHLAVGAVGAGTRIQAFAMLPPMALGSVIVPFMGQNFGANEWSRIRRGLKASLVFGSGWGVLAALLLFALAPPIAAGFIDDPRVVPFLVQFLAVVPLGFAGTAVFQLITATLNGIDRPFQSAGLNVGRVVFLMIPFAWLGARWWDFQGLLWGMAISNLLAGAAAFVLFRTCCQDVPPVTEPR